MNQCEQITCIKHPSDVVVAVCVTETCQTSRLACFQCLQEGMKIEKYVDFRKFQNDIDELVKVASTNGNLHSKQLNQHINIMGKVHMQKYCDFIHQLLKMFNDLRALIIESIAHYREFRKHISDLKQCFMNELRQVNIQLDKIAKVPNYHQSKEWQVMEDKVSNYLKLFYTNNNIDNEIQKVYLRLNKPHQDMQHVQEQIENVCKSITKSINTLIYGDEGWQLVYNKLETPLVSTAFLNLIISKTMKEPQFSLIYKGSRDGLNAVNFWLKCQNKGPTLIICRSKNGQVFGGYTTANWIPNGEFQTDASLKSFLFSSSRNQFYVLKNANYAILGLPNKGPIFGNSMEMVIDGDFQNGSSKLTNTTYSTKGFKIQDQHLHLFGGLTPSLDEMEVYIQQ